MSRLRCSKKKMIVFLMRLTVPFAVSKNNYCCPPIQINRGPRDWQAICSLVEGCRLTNSNFSSIMEMTKVLLSSKRSILAHKSSSFKIEDAGLENLCSSLPPSEVDKLFFTMLHPTSVFLVSLLKCCNRFSLNLTRPLCRLFAFSPPCLFAAWRVEAPFFRGFPCRLVLHVVLSLTRRVIVHDATTFSREESLYECGHPVDALSCLFFSALLVQQSQSLSVQEIQSAKDIDLTCFMTFPITAA